MVTLALVVAGFLAGCGTPSGQAGPSGTLAGRIIEIGGPEAEHGHAPPPRPLEAEAAVYPAGTDTSSGAADKPVVATTRSAADGRFSLSLPAGSYVVVARNDQGAIMTSDRKVTIKVGATVGVRLVTAVP
jgi:hypothetical protein